MCKKLFWFTCCVDKAMLNSDSDNVSYTEPTSDSDNSDMADIRRDFKNATTMFDTTQTDELEDFDVSGLTPLQLPGYRIEDSVIEHTSPRNVNKKRMPQVFRWCTCHRYLSSINQSVDWCFSDCELREESDDNKKYLKATLAEYLVNHCNMAYQYGKPRRRKTRRIQKNNTY